MVMVRASLEGRPTHVGERSEAERPGGMCPARSSWLRPLPHISPACGAALPCRHLPCSQVLKEVGMDAAQADELWGAASGGSSPGGSDRASSPPSSRSLSYEDFRRVLLNQPPGIVTKVGRLW